MTGIYNIINGVNCLIILTTAPNDSVAPIHDRMPLMLSHEQVRPWLVDAVPFEDATADCAAVERGWHPCRVEESPPQGVCRSV